MIEAEPRSSARARIGIKEQRAQQKTCPAHSPCIQHGASSWRACRALRLTTGLTIMTERLKEDARAMAMCAAPASRQFCRPKGSRFGRTAEGGKKEGGAGLLGACTVQPPSAARLVGTTSPGIFARWRRILCLAAFRAAEHTVNFVMFRINAPNVGCAVRLF